MLLNDKRQLLMRGGTTTAGLAGHFKISLFRYSVSAIFELMIRGADVPNDSNIAPWMAYDLL